MKLAIICLTKDFNRPGNSGSYRDYLYIKKELEEIGEVVTINADNVEKEFWNTYDGIVMLNASVNFFGGVLNETVVNKWEFIANQKCPIMYWFTDFLLPLTKSNEIINKRFGRKLKEIDSKRITVISYAQETGMTMEWWNKNKKNVPIQNIIYYPISESCYKHLPHLVPKNDVNQNVVYIGNFRNGHRLKQIEKLAIELNNNLTIYGRWPEKFVPFGVDYKGPCLEIEVDEILNNHFSQYITYDYEYIKFRPDIFRHIITINSGSIPLIDPKLYYLEPKITSERDLRNSDFRIHQINMLQETLKTYFPNDFSQLIKQICS